MKFITNYVGKLPTVGFKTEGVSKTIPGDEVNLSELMKRAFHGQDVKLMNRFGVYDDDPSYDEGMVLVRKPDVDLTDIEIITDHLKRTREIIAEKQLEAKPEQEEPSPEPTPEEPTD